MKKISLKGISSILSDKELKNIMGGSGQSCGVTICKSASDCWSGCSVCKDLPNWGGTKTCYNY
ncbi:bacteriocin [Dysgonomonas termitidis]|uniref:bacteriocin n=1 Tax=Dysgonomonas termitidis TaxID=1516126 RepID=UPI0036D43004